MGIFSTMNILDQLFTINGDPKPIGSFCFLNYFITQICIVPTFYSDYFLTKNDFFSHFNGTWGISKLLIYTTYWSGSILVFKAHIPPKNGFASGRVCYT